DMHTFLKILDLDNDNHKFNSSMAWAHFDQTAVPFGRCTAHPRLSFPVSADSSLCHFLKVSSAALDVPKLQRSCEQIQHLGPRWDVNADVQSDVEE
ncbi:hypothetical protein JB92DRAFT_2640433, partial [Gautieria morchelliformis]